jgi:hypothetical protein
MRLVHLLPLCLFFAFCIAQDTHNAFQDALSGALPPCHPGNIQLLPLVKTVKSTTVSGHVKRSITTRYRTAWHSRGTSQRRHPQLLLLPPLIMSDRIHRLPMDRPSRGYLLPWTRIVNLQRPRGQSSSVPCRANLACIGEDLCGCARGSNGVEQGQGFGWTVGAFGVAYCGDGGFDTRGVAVDSVSMLRRWSIAVRAGLTATSDRQGIKKGKKTGYRTQVGQALTAIFKQEQCNSRNRSYRKIESTLYTEAQKSIAYRCVSSRVPLAERSRNHRLDNRSDRSRSEHTHDFSNDQRIPLPSRDSRLSIRYQPS